MKAEKAKLAQDFLAIQMSSADAKKHMTITQANSRADALYKYDNRATSVKGITFSAGGRETVEYRAGDRRKLTFVYKAGKKPKAG